MNDTRGGRCSWLLLVAGVFILASAWLPLLTVRFTSPQYPTDKPTLAVYSDKITGDAHEFQVLSHYVGIIFPPEVPEMESGLLKWVFAGLGVAALIASILPRKTRKISASLLVLAVLFLAAWGQYRFYQSGHTLDPEAPMRMAVKPFTPPLFGWVKIHKIAIYHLPHIGSALMLGALGSLLLSFRRGKRGEATG
ncbi:MAG: hypothetical protein CL908_04885 [Deltaproteobacteria bacterium]|nr:hypothetical protein [Deltaproteobacteria bacterium]